MSADAAQGKTPPLRLFFALWPRPPQQQALAGASAAGVAASRGRSIPAANLHVTLAFLGNVDPARLPQLHQLARGLAGTCGTGPLTLQFVALEHWVRPQILCATGGGAVHDSKDGAFALAASIRQATLAAGFTPDLKPFHAHVTVARKVASAPQVQPLPPVTWQLDAFALVASVTGAAGSLYSVLESYPLDGLENARK